jgi:uncharacterized protein (DUF305 family)
MAATSDALPRAGAPADPDPPAPPSAAPTPGRWERWFGPLTPLKLVVLLVAVLFLGATAGYAFRDRESQASSAVDVGFLRDMSTHHNQAVVIARTALAGELPDEVAVYADEIVVTQQFEFGLMQATLYRYNEEPLGDGTAMGWMGMPVPEDEMPGLATGEELSRLEELDGEDAAELFFALMSRHHLGGAHMSEEAAAEASDPYVRELADRMARSQIAEIQEYGPARARLGIGLPDGYPESPEISVPPERDTDGGPGPLLPIGVGLVVAAGAVAAVAWVVAGRAGRREDDDGRSARRRTEEHRGDDV